MSFACSSSSLFGTSLQTQTLSARRGIKQICTAREPGPKGKFFSRPGGDRREGKRFDQSETKKKKSQVIPLDKKLRDAWPGKSVKMANARNRGPQGDGKTIKTSNKVPGSQSLPEDTAPFVAGGLAVFLLTIVLLATGNLGAGKIQLPTPPNPTEVVSQAQE